MQQDFMCEPLILNSTGLTVEAHQELTTSNYLALSEALQGSGLYVMAVIQGFAPEQYAAHVRDLSPHLETGAWVGVGSVCKRQGQPALLSAILTAILREREDLKLHGFGVKTTALQKADISERFHSVDSMAWSYAGRRMVPAQTHSATFCKEWTARVSNCDIQPSQSALL